MYKDNMHPTVSKAELALFQELSKRCLTKNMVTQEPIVLRMTKPDFAWLEKRKLVYLDGIPVHSSDKAIENDQEIDNLLELKGWQVLRIPYNPPLSKQKLQEIADQIQQFVGEL